MEGKNMHLLGRERSPNWQPTIQEIIADLQEELTRGAAVYTVDELRILERKLADYEQLFRGLTGP